MNEIKLTREEARKLKNALYWDLRTKAEYHYDLQPSKRASLATLVELYCYWANEYNDGYMSEMDESDKVSMYLVQEYKKLFGYKFFIIIYKKSLFSRTFFFYSYIILFYDYYKNDYC